MTPSRPHDSKSSGARVLISGECIAILEEKQEKEKEEKEQRKLMRAEQKQKREEQKIAKERPKKLAQKQADKERKEAEKVAKQAEKQAAKTTEGSTRVSQKRPALSRPDIAHDRSRPKAPKLSSPEHINPNQCCACFGLYEDDIGTGVERLQCSCTR